MKRKTKIKKSTLAKKSHTEVSDILENKAIASQEGSSLETESTDAETSKSQQKDYSMPYRDTLKVYLYEIKQFPLLSVEEEKGLAKKIKKRDKEARARMIKGNLRLVVSIAKRYTKLGVSFPDLIEEGNLGLMKAVDRYNPDHGYRFSTYASWWIKQCIIRALANQGKTIRIPVHMIEIINRLRKTTERLTQESGRLPTDSELAERLKISEERVRAIKSVIQNPASLSEPVGEGGTMQLINLIENQESSSPLKEVAALVERERIMNLMDKLTPREAEIVKLRFGLENNEPHTLEETGRKFGITRERIRQLESSIIKKLKLYISQEEKGIEIKRGGSDDNRKIKRKNQGHTRFPKKRHTFQRYNHASKGQKRL